MRGIGLFRCVLGVALAVAGTTSVLAEAVPLAGWTFYEENDVFAHTDRYYTQGLKFAWSYPRGRSPRVDRAGLRFWMWLDREAPAVTQTGWSFGQNMYTPRDIQRRTQDRDDRPWAGWLYVGRTLVVQSLCAGQGSGCRPEQHLFELDLGVVGELAAARWTQTEFHKLIDSPKPLGWDNQIGNEPGLLLRYRGERQFGNAIADASPRLVAALGNVFTYAGAGGTLRLGYNLSGFVAERIPAVLREEARPVEAYVFADLEGRGVLRNITLEGNTFRDSYSVEKKRWIYEFAFGAAARWKGWSVTYTRVHRSPEFVARSGRSVEPQEFGSVALSWSRWSS